MSLEHEQIIRKAYQIAEDKDIPGWVAAFTEDGTFIDESIGVTYRGQDELGVVLHPPTMRTGTWHIRMVSPGGSSTNERDGYFRRRP